MFTKAYIFYEYGKQAGDQPMHRTYDWIVVDTQWEPTNILPMLCQTYYTDNRVKKLIALGGLYSLKNILKPKTKGHSMKSPEPWVVISYGRDAWWEYEVSRHNCTLHRLIDIAVEQDSHAYIYIFRDKVWHYYDAQHNMLIWVESVYNMF